MIYCFLNSVMNIILQQKLAEALALNKTLRTVNVESNFLTGEVLVELVKAINVNQTLLELRVANQVREGNDTIPPCTPIPGVINEQ